MNCESCKAAAQSRRHLAGKADATKKKKTHEEDEVKVKILSADSVFKLFLIMCLLCCIILILLRLILLCCEETR